MELLEAISEFLGTASVTLLLAIVCFPVLQLAVSAALNWFDDRGVVLLGDFWLFLAGPGAVPRRSEVVLAVNRSGARKPRRPARPAAPLDGSTARRDAGAGASVVFGLERRRARRLKTCLLGTLHPDPGARAENLCTILDLSAGGARIRPVEALPRGDRVTLGLRHFGAFPARVVWRSGKDIGLQFEWDPERVANAMQGLVPAARSAA